MRETGNKISLKRKITDDSFQEDIPESYDLFIFASHEEISCAAAERNGKKFVALESWEINDDDFKDGNLLDIIKQESKLLSLSGYPRVICCSGFHHSTLVPSPLFDPATAAEHIRFSNQGPEGGQLITDEIHQLEAANIFTIPRGFYQTISSWFQLAEFHHTSTALIEYLFTVNRNSKEEMMKVNVHRTFIEIIVTRGRQLLLYNYFNYDTPEELVYYILFVCEQLHLNPDHIKLQFAGEIYEPDSAFQLTTRYVRNTALAIRPEIYSYGGAFRELPLQNHFNLFSQVICAS